VHRWRQDAARAPIATPAKGSAVRVARRGLDLVLGVAKVRRIREEIVGELHTGP
jgi:hypothetical protein